MSMATIILPEWVLWLVAAALVAHVGLSVVRVLLVREVRRFCADRGLTNAELRQVLELCKRAES